MKTNTTTFAGISIIILMALALVAVFEIRVVAARVGATSSLPSSNGTTTVAFDASTSMTEADVSTTPTVSQPDEASIGSNATTSTISAVESANAPATSTTAIEPPPAGLTLVHIVGTKYTDYFTDGTTTVSFPGDPAIDGNLDKPNAPIPTHEGLTWMHTTGGYLCTTPRAATLRLAITRCSPQVRTSRMLPPLSLPLRPRP
jgi:hypothetical protein